MPDLSDQYDVVVAGGGAAGVGAAIGAAKTGARVALIEKYGFLGGAATNAQVLAYCGFYHQGDDPIPAVAGVGDIVLDEMCRLGVECAPYHSPTTSNWIILLDPERLKVALDRVLAEHGIDLFLHARVTGAERDGTALKSVEAAAMDGTLHLGAGGFVDASGDANLALVAGQPMRIGDGEGRIQAYTMPLRVGGLAPDTRIDREAMKRAVEIFNTRSQHKIHRTDGGIYTRVPASSDFWWLIIDREMPDLSTQSYTRAEQTGREMALLMVDVLRDNVAGFGASWLAQTGPQIGVRETRHPAARYEVRRADVIGGVTRSDGIARAAWPIELHSEAGKPLYERVGGEGYYHIPLDALHADGLDNLWYAGRVIGADPVAYGSTRVMGTAFATGQAAGVAAALGAQNGAFPNVEKVRVVLAEQGALL